jgi:hypothetical protein
MQHSQNNMSQHGFGGVCVGILCVLLFVSMSQCTAQASLLTATHLHHGAQAESRVTSVREIRKRGLYNVHAAGDMLVDGVAMSSYNGRVSRALSKILLAVARVAYRVMGVRAFEAVNAAYLSLDGNAVLALASGPAGFSAGGTGAHRA